MYVLLLLPMFVTFIEVVAHLVQGVFELTVNFIEIRYFFSKTHLYLRLSCLIYIQAYKVLISWSIDWFFIVFFHIFFSFPLDTPYLSTTDISPFGCNHFLYSSLRWNNNLAKYNGCIHLVSQKIILNMFKMCFATPG